MPKLLQDACNDVKFGGNVLVGFSYSLIVLPNEGL